MRLTNAVAQSMRVIKSHPHSNDRALTWTCCGYLVRLGPLKLRKSIGFALKTLDDP